MTISKELEATLQLAIAEAKRRHHEYLTLEHLLLALCADPAAAKILRALGADFARLTQELEGFFREQLEEKLEDGADPKQTPQFWRVLQRAAMHVHGAGKDTMDGGNVLVSLFREKDSHSVYLLEHQGVTRLDVLRYVAHGMTKTDGSKAGRLEPTTDEDEEVTDEDDASDPLATYTVNLVERARKGGIDPLIGRSRELERMVQVLCRRRKNNPVLVGDPGVGKTAIVEGLALAIHEKRVPKLLERSTIYSLDMGAVLAGTKFRGQFEERIKAVVKEIMKDRAAILF